MVSTAPAVKFGVDAFSEAPLELWENSSLGEMQTVIRAVYRQVLGNAHIMESERLVTAESMLCDGNISVRGFVEAVAKSEFYRTRFFETCSAYRFVELNFKHLLGRAPVDQTEIAQHILIINEQGYDAEINSYLDSEEYQESFGENVVPYYRGINSIVGQKQVSYNRMFSVFRGPGETDSAVKTSKLVYEIATNSANKITPPISVGRLGGYADATEKTFKIVVKGVKFSGPSRVSTKEYIVPGSKMTPQIQRINRTSGTIVSITEIG